MPYTQRYKPASYESIEPITRKFYSLLANGPGSARLRVLSGTKTVRWKLYDFLHHMALQNKINRNEWKVSIDEHGVLTLTFLKPEVVELGASPIPEKLASEPQIIPEEAFELAEKYIGAFGPRWAKWPQVSGDLDDNIRSAVFEALKSLIPQAPPQEILETQSQSS